MSIEEAGPAGWLRRTVGGLWGWLARADERLNRPRGSADEKGPQAPLPGEPKWVVAAADEEMAVLVDVGRSGRHGKLAQGWSALAWRRPIPAADGGEGHVLKLQLSEYDPAGRRVRTLQCQWIDAEEVVMHAEFTPAQRFLAVAHGTVAQTVLDWALRGESPGASFPDPMSARAAWISATS